MPVVKLKPTSPGQRHTVLVRDGSLSKSRPHRALSTGKKRISCRNHHGRITVRRRGGGHKRLYRTVDFKRQRDGIPATVKGIEYDPNRSAHLALICYADGVWNYIIAPDGLAAGDVVQSGTGSPIKTGNTLKIKDIPVGTIVHNIEMRPSKGGQMMRSAGSFAVVLGKEGAYASVRCRSGEVRRILLECCATIGVVSNKQHNLRQKGKAGRSRWEGRRPTVRGVAMNPVDHPLGGGEGKTSGGRVPCTPWGVPTKGKRTRSCKRTDPFIMRRRKTGKK